MSQPIKIVLYLMGRTTTKSPFRSITDASDLEKVMTKRCNRAETGFKDNLGTGIEFC